SHSYDRGKTFFPATPINHWFPAKTLDQIIQQLKAAKLRPFDQPTIGTGPTATARALGFPNIVAGIVNGRTKPFSVWQARVDIGPGSQTFGQRLSTGSPRIVFSMSSDGGYTWTARTAIDAGLRLDDDIQGGKGRISGPQVQPVLTISGRSNTQLLLAYYEARR